MRSFLKQFVVLGILCAVGLSQAGVWDESPLETSEQKRARQDSIENARLQKLAAKEKLSLDQDMEGAITDPRDGQVYTVKLIKNQLWMTQNLNFKTRTSYCFENNERNCSKAGRLYTWKGALEACPDGWRLPTVDEILSVAYVDKFLSESGGFRAFNGDFYNFKTTAAYWTADEDPNYRDYGVFISPSPMTGGWSKTGFYKDQANSVRCIKGQRKKNRF